MAIAHLQTSKPITWHTENALKNINYFPSLKGTEARSTCSQPTILHYAAKKGYNSKRQLPKFSGETYLT